MQNELVKLAKSGNEAAIRELLQIYDPTMNQFARKLCVTNEDAADSVQHARLVIAQKIHTFKEISKITTWLYAVIKNECYKLQKKMFGFSIHGAPEKELLQRPGLDEQIDRNLLLQKVSRCLSLLNPDELEILMMKDVEGHSLEEISQALAISLAATKSRLYRARQNLKIVLSKSKVQIDAGSL